MKNLMKFENLTLSNYKRGLIDFNTALANVSGYIICMTDMEVIEKDRATEEYTLFVKMLMVAER